MDIAQTVKAYGADLLGFVFAESRRRIAPEDAQRIAREITGVGKVGVFVNAPLQEVQDIARRCCLDFVQLHGEETPDYCRALKIPVIKAFQVRDAGFDPAELDAYGVDWVLLDTYCPGSHGGTGVAFDWRRTAELCRQLKTPFIAAGGLTPDNVAEAVGILQPAGVDVSGGVETAGQKDVEKIGRFIQAVRTAQGGSNNAG